jgi:hypothetical protein
MNAVKHGEKNVQKGKTPAGNEWEEANQGEKRAGPGHEGALSPTTGDILKDGVHNRYTMRPGSTQDGTGRKNKKQRH